jgi:hypothetical protein
LNYNETNLASYEWTIPTELFDAIYYNSSLRISGVSTNSENKDYTSDVIFSNVPMVEFISPTLNQEFNIGDVMNITLKNNMSSSIHIYDCGFSNKDNWINDYLDIDIASGEQYTYTKTIDINNFNGSDENFIILYTYNATYGYNYIFSDNFIINGPQITISNDYIEYEGVLVNEMSDIRTVIISGTELDEDLNIYIPEYFYGSIDGVNYVTDDYLLVPQTNGTIENQLLYFYFLPDDDYWYENDIEIYTESGSVSTSIHILGWGFYSDYEYITVDRTEIDFGDVELYDYKIETVTVNANNLNEGLWLYIEEDKSIENALVSIDNINFYEELYLEGTDYENLTAYIRFIPTDINSYYFDFEIYGYDFSLEIEIYGNGVEKNTPIVNVSEYSQYFGNVIPGETSEAQTFVVDGKNLESEVTITAPEGFQISDDGINYYTTLNIIPNESKIIEPTTIYSVFIPTEIMLYTGIISIECENIETKQIELLGQGSQAILTAQPSIKYTNALAGQISYNVISNTSWIASSTDEWVTVESSGNGNGELLVMFDENIETYTRTATITLTSENTLPFEVQLEQSGYEPILFSETDYVQFNSGIDTYELPVISNVEWTTTTIADWFTITESGSGNGIVTITVEENLSNEWRGENIELIYNGGSYYYIYVEQRNFENYLTVNTSLIITDYFAGSQNIDVNSNVLWTASTENDWLSVSENKENGSFAINYEMNYGEQRVGYIKIENQVEDRFITIIQTALVPELEINPENISVSDFEGETTIDLMSNTDWTASSSETWCTLSETSGNGNSVLTATYEANISVERTATITVEVDGITKSITLTQAAFSDPQIVSDFENQDVTYEAGTVDFGITSPIDWTAESDAEWCNVSISKADAVLTAVYSENTDITSRIATITLTGADVYSFITKTITVTQAGFISIDETSNLSFSIYPNPASDFISISKQKTNIETIEISDLTGKVIISTTNTKIDISTYPAGVYFVKIETTDGNFVEKLIKK